ncbi:unnamed protein product [Owenia fusiformis]|uniref:Cytochrome P450 n=1 Tax=Owenia fusiformis TaxID=6347 RepID=A0A8S4NUK7_OWEFU|nr:unnamed protein product [Owenia fusiformis]
MYPVYIVALVTLVLYLCMRFFVRHRKPGEPPLVPYKVPFLGSGLEFNKDAYKFLSDCQKEYGDVFTIYLAGKYYTFILNPRNYGVCFKQSSDVLSFRTAARTTLTKVFGVDQKVVIDTAPYSKTHTRPAVTKGLQGEGLEGLSQTMQMNLHKMLKGLTLVGNEWQTMGLLDFCYLTVFSTAFISIFGENEQDLANMSTIIKNFREFDNSFIGFLSGLPKQMLKKALKAREYLHDLLCQENGQKRRNISELLELRHAAFEAIGKEIFPDSAHGPYNLSFLWASQGNTIPAIFWSLYYTIKHPEATEAALEEVREKLGPIDEAKEYVTYTKEQYDELEIFDSIISETLRLTSFSMIVRDVVEDVTLQLTTGEVIGLRGGDRVALQACMVHRDPEIYENPLEFQYDRFLRNKTFYKNGSRLRYNMLPYGGGSNMCPVYIVALVTLVLYLCMRFFVRHRKPGEPPLVPYKVPFLGSGLEFNKDAYKFLSDCQKEYGDVFTIYLAGKYYTFILNPRNYGVCFKQSSDVLSFRTAARTTLTKVFGVDQKVVIDTAPYSKTHTRPAVTKGLQGEGLEGLSQTMQMNLHKMLKGLTLVGNEWQTMELLDFCYLTVFSTAFISIFGENEQDLANMSTIIKNFREFDNSFVGFLSGLPKQMLKKALKAREYLHDLLCKEKGQKRRNISELLELRHAAFEAIGKEIFPDSAHGPHNLSFLWASQGNTIPAIFWSLYYTIKHPEATEAALEEVREKLGPIDEAKEYVTYTKEQYDELEIFDSIISETLRLTSFSMIVRDVVEDVTLQLTTGEVIGLRGGDRVALQACMVHRDPEIYENPLEFQYDRFLRNKTFYKNGSRLRYNMLQYGGGSSMCPGRFFANLEIKQTIIFLKRYFDLEFVDPQCENPGISKSRAGLGIMPPEKDVQIRFRPKKLN